MPKLTHRCNRRGRFGGPPAASVAFMAPPRKVSFEDNPHDSDSNSDPGSPDSIKPVELLTVLTEEAAPRLSRKPTLVRPKSSLSLVDLAGNDDNSTHHAAQTCLSAPVSPIMHPQEVDIFSSPQMPGSPWGHFVDMVIAYEEPRPAPHHYHNSPCNSCSSCRRRRANPYGEYKTKSKSRPLCFVQDPSCEKPTMLQHFRLSPRHEPTDQLIGALHRLQVD